MLVHLCFFYKNTIWKKNTEIQNMKSSSYRWRHKWIHAIGYMAPNPDICQFMHNCFLFNNDRNFVDLWDEQQK
eukprot:12935992-Prorocentrum_lima.AAC.1